MVSGFFVSKDKIKDPKNLELYKTVFFVDFCKKTVDRFSK